MTAASTTVVSRTATKPVRVALAGNPNSGKTSIFNALTGARRRVGNYPGVTVEKRIGNYTHEGVPYDVVDLPGTYSLSSYSPEERITERELLTGRCDITVVVVDSTNLKRSLVLLAQIMQTGANPVLCLNMADEARAAGQRINIPQMEALLGCPVVETVGHRGSGLLALQAAITASAGKGEGPCPSRLVLATRLTTALDAIAQHLSQANRWAATRLLVGDPFMEKHVVDSPQGPRAIAEAKNQRAAIEFETGLDIKVFVAEQWFGFVDGLLREVVERAPRSDARVASDRIDSVVAHRLWGLPIFGAVMYAIFWLTFSVGEMPMAWIASGFAWLGHAVSSLWPASSTSAMRSLLVDGVIGGVGGVIVFLPNILLLFFGLALLEDTGYLARAAFLVDRFMHRFGLHGKSFIPLLTGFGCSIPGIMATRTLENERDRLATMLVLPLMSCGARLPIWLLLIPAFFPPAWRAPMLWFIYAIGVGLALTLALLLRKSLLCGEEAPFVMELPPYRVPTMRAVVVKVTERGWLYLRKAGTVILAISIVMWFLSAYPRLGSQDTPLSAAVSECAAAPGPHGANPDHLAAPESPTVTEDERAAQQLRHSFAGRIGRAMEPVLAPLGFDWRLATAMLGAFAAKEVFVAQLGIVYSLGETDEESLGLRHALQRDYSPLTAFSMMLFLLIATPCMATIAVTRRESGSWKWALLQLGGLTAIAYVVSLLVYQTGRLFI